MSNKRLVITVIGIAVVLGTLTFVLKRFTGLDFTSFGIGILMATIAFLIIKAKKS